MSTTFGRAVLAKEISSWDQSGDSITTGGKIQEATPEDGIRVARQLAGYDNNRDVGVIRFLSTSFPEANGFYRVLGTKVTPVGAPAEGLWTWTASLERVTASALPVMDVAAKHYHRSGYAVNAATSRALIGWPATYAFEARDDALPVSETALVRTSATGDVITKRWPADEAQALWRVVQVAPEDWEDGACRILAGAELVEPNVLPELDSWWDVRAYTPGATQLDDLSGNGRHLSFVNGVASPGDSYPVVPCLFDDGDPQYAFFPGWADEGCSSDPVTPTGVLRFECHLDLHDIDVGGADSIVMHQGSDADELGFAFGFTRATGAMFVIWSPDGTTANTVSATALPVLGTGGYRAWQRDPATGLVTFYEKAQEAGAWQQVGDPVITAPGAVNTDASQTLSMSGTELFGGLGCNMGGFVRDARLLDDGVVIAGPDFEHADRPFSTWEGLAGETWSAFRATSTGSYRFDIIDRQCLQLGNGAHLASSSSFFNVDAAGSAALIACVAHQSDTPAFNGWGGKASLDLNPGDEPAWGMADLDVDGPGAAVPAQLALISDGADTVIEAFGPEVPVGTPATVAMVIDRANQDLIVYTDGTAAASPADITAVGDMSNAHPLRVGAFSNGGQMALYGAGFAARAPSAAEIAHAGPEFLTAELPESNSIDEQLATYEPITDRQMPAGGWCLTNDLVRCYPSLTGGRLSTQHFDGAAWSTAKDWQFTLNNGWGFPLEVIESCTVNRNAEHIAGLRIAGSLAASAASQFIDLTVRRGDRILYGTMTPANRDGSSGPTGFDTLGVLRDTAEAATDIPGGIRATADDADGHRYVLLSAAAEDKDLVDGGLEDDDDEGVIDFGIGLAIDGAAAVSGDTTTDLAAQYGAWASVGIRVTTP